MPGVDPDHPYGEGTSYVADMATRLGTLPAANADGVEPRLRKLHREMQPALQIFLRYADLGPGDFRAGMTGRWEPA